MNVSSSTQVPPQLAAGASHSNCSSHAHAPHATENLFSIDQLFYGTHSRMTYNHSRIVNHFAMLSRTTTNHINLPQQKTFTYHSPLPFLNLHSRNYFLTTSRWRPPRSGFFPVGESLNIINSNSNSKPWNTSKALWRAPVVSCCGGLAIMAQEAKSWDPGSIPGRDTSFDVPESSCLLSGPGLQLDSRYTGSRGWFGGSSGMPSAGEEDSVTGTLKHVKSSVARTGGIVLRWSSGYGAGG